MSSTTPSTPASNSASEGLDAIDTGSAALFREMTGMTNTAEGQALSDEELIARPIDSFDIDSLTTMEFIMGIEDRFGVELNEAAVNRCKTIAELAALVRQEKRV